MNIDIGNNRQSALSHGTGIKNRDDEKKNE
jgi:hypothetical protein